MLQNYKTQLIQKTQLTSDVFLYRFKLLDPSVISFIPGQYLILFVPQENGEKINRLYSIASSNTSTSEFELLVKLIPNGCASKYLEKLEIGSEATFQGPAGMFTLRDPPAGGSRDKVFMVTGTGYAPVRSMFLSRIKNLESKIFLFIGFPYYKDVFLFEELKNLQSSILNLKSFICLSREQNLDMVPEEDKKYFFLGRVTNGLENLILDTGNWKLENPTSNLQSQNLAPSIQYQTSNFDYYLCSGRDIVESLKQYLYQKGAPKEQVFFEKF